MKITCTNRSLRGKLDLLGENHDKVVLDSKNTISKGRQDVSDKETEVNNLLKRCNVAGHVCIDACREKKENAAIDLQKAKLSSNGNAHFAILFDNIDGQMKRRNMTKENQNYDYHWVNHRVVINRVLANNLDQSRKNVLDVSNIKLLPTVQDQKHQRYNYTVLVARMLVEHFDFFKSFKDVCVQHIPHKYSKELSKKSESVSMLPL